MQGHCYPADAGGLGATLRLARQQLARNLVQAREIARCRQLVSGHHLRYQFLVTREAIGRQGQADSGSLGIIGEVDIQDSASYRVMVSMAAGQGGSAILANPRIGGEVGNQGIAGVAGAADDEVAAAAFNDPAGRAGDAHHRQAHGHLDCPGGDIIREMIDVDDQRQGR